MVGPPKGTRKRATFESTLAGFSTRSTMGTIISATVPSASATTASNTTPNPIQIRYGRAYCNSRFNCGESNEATQAPPVLAANSRSAIFAGFSGFGSPRYASRRIRALSSFPPCSIAHIRLCPALRPGLASLAGSLPVRQVRSVRNRIVPPGKRRSFRNPPLLFLYIPVHDFRRESFLLQILRDPLPQHHRAMLPPRAPDGNRQITLPFLDVMRNQIRQHAFESPQKFLRLRKGVDISLHLLVLPGELAQLRHKMRIRQESHVKHQVRIRRNPVLVSEAHKRKQHRTVIWILEPLRDELPQLVHIEFARIDYHVRQIADRLHQGALARQAFAHRTIFSQRMRPARLAVPSQQRVFARFDVYQRDGMVLLQMFQQRGQFLEMRALPRIHQQRCAREIAFPCGVQLRKNRNQLDGQVVHAIKAHILERAQDRALPRSGETRQDNELSCVTAPRLHGGLVLYPALVG